MKLGILLSCCISVAMALFCGQSHATGNVQYFACIQSSGGSSTCTSTTALRSNSTTIAGGAIVSVAGWNEPGDGGGGNFVVGSTCPVTTMFSATPAAGDVVVTVPGVSGVQIGEAVTDTAGAIQLGSQVAVVGVGQVTITLPAISSPTGPDTLTFSPDNSGTIIVDAEPNCFYRTNYRGDPHEWGAYGDGTHDDTTAMQNWLGAYGAVQTTTPANPRKTFGPFTATMPGTYLVSTPLTCPQDTTIQGPANMTNTQPVFTIQASATFSGFLPADATTTSTGSVIAAQAVIGALADCRMSGVSIVGNGYYLPTTGTPNGADCISSIGTISSLRPGNRVTGPGVPAQTVVLGINPTACTGLTPPAVQVSNTIMCTMPCPSQKITFYGPDAVDVLAQGVAIEGFSAISNGGDNVVCVPTLAQGTGLQIKNTQITGAMNNNFDGSMGCSNVRLIRDNISYAGAGNGSGPISITGGIPQDCGPTSLTCDGIGVLYSGFELTISDGSISSSQGHGLALNTAERVSVNAMHIESNGLGASGGEGIQINGKSAAGINSHTISICGNYFIGNGGDIANSSHISFDGNLDNINLCGNVYEPASLDNVTLRPQYVYDVGGTPVITNLHLYDSPAPQASGQVYSSGGLTYLPQLQVPHVPLGQISGLTMSNHAGGSTQVDIAPGEASDSANTVTIARSTQCPVDLSASGVNGRDTLSGPAANTTYFYFLIASASGGNASCIASTNTTPDLTNTTASLYAQTYTGGIFINPTTLVPYLYNLDSISGLAPGQVVQVGGSTIATISSVPLGTTVGTISTQALATSIAQSGMTVTVTVPSTDNIAIGMPISDTFKFSSCTGTAQGKVKGSTGYTVATVSTGSFTFQAPMGTFPTTLSNDCITVSSGYTVQLNPGATAYSPPTTFTVFNGVYRAIGALYTTSTAGVPVPFLQDGDTFYLKTSVTDIDTSSSLCASSIGTTAIMCPLSVPCGRNATGCSGTSGTPSPIIDAFGRMIGGSAFVLVSNPGLPPQTPVNFPTAPGFSSHGSTLTSNTAYPFRLQTDQLGSVQVQSSGTASAVFEVTDGWIYHR